MNRNAKIALGIAVGVGIAYWLRSGLQADANSNTRSVTRVTSGATVNTSKTPVTSTPLKTSALAFVQGIASNIRAAFGGGSANPNVPSIQNRTPANAKLYPYGSPTLARAAFTSPTQTPVSNYRASSYIPRTAPYSLN